MVWEIGQLSLGRLRALPGGHGFVTAGIRAAGISFSLNRFSNHINFPREILARSLHELGSASGGGDLHNPAHPSLPEVPIPLLRWQHRPTQPPRAPGRAGMFIQALEQLTRRVRCSPSNAAASSHVCWGLTALNTAVRSSGLGGVGWDGMGSVWGLRLAGRTGNAGFSALAGGAGLPALIQVTGHLCHAHGKVLR